MAQLLKERGVVAAPEQIVKDPFGARRMPDVLVDFQGLRLAIEGEFTSRVAQQKASHSALKRVEEGIAHIGMALIYPASLRDFAPDIVQLKKALTEISLEFAVVTENEATRFQPTLPGLPEKKTDAVLFAKGDLDGLVDALRRSYEQLVKEEVLQTAVDILEHGVGIFRSSLTIQPATASRFASALGIRELPKKIGLRQADAIHRIAGLVVVNAMMFQEVLAQKEKRVRNLDSLQDESDLKGALADHWKFILDEINYYPIFHIARDLLTSISPDISAVKAVNELAERAKKIVGMRASLRHDLAGRIYHRLLAEAKYLGAYYTSIPAAVLLAKLALRPEDFDRDWANLKELSTFRVCDLACGTGTLLMAAADVIVDNHIRESAKQKKEPQLFRLHSTIVEKVLFGFDVLPSAVHLTASTLALRVPDVPVNVTNLATLPLGSEHIQLGSLELLLGRSVEAASLFADKPKRILGKGEQSEQQIGLPDLDFCIMNPPFTSSRKANLLFGGIPEKDRIRMQKRLKSIVREHKVSASITAGLGSVFVALADKYLKPNGRLALVLPRALLSGISWEKTRNLINQSYRLEYIIACHEADHWNFSENTDLSEVLVIARKTETIKPGEDPKVACVNLWRHPRNAVESLTLSQSVLTLLPHLQVVDHSQAPATLNIGSVKYGEVLAVNWSELKRDLWNFPCAFAQFELVRTLYALRRGILRLPGEKKEWELPLCPLSELGELGPDPRDVYDAFDLAAYKSAYPALWGHDPLQVQHMTAKPNAFLEPLSRPRAGRKLRKSEDIWPRAGHILITMRTRLNTKRLAAVRLSRKVLSDVWWPFMMKERRSHAEEVEKTLVLWLNSTIGLVILLAHREETEGAWVQFKKPTLKRMPVLDIWNVGAKRLKRLAAAFDRLADQALLPFSHMEEDPVRAEIDEAVASALGLPDFSILRQLLAREPIICLSMDRLALPEA
ncbi:MAG: N-6 DNA methylase [Acidobacteria bacterium]|nr:N-6 DNA methylase [Acidobacteriota bacterium]